MEEQLVSFETAKLAKEKGFDLSPDAGIKFFIDKDGKKIATCFYPIGNYNDVKPANYKNFQYLPQHKVYCKKWLREKTQNNSFN